MFFYRKLISIILCCSLCISVLMACGKGTDDNPSTQVTAELKRAVSVGLMPEDWCERLGDTISFKEYAEVLNVIVERWDVEQFEQWKNITAQAAQSDEPMEREDGLLMLSYLWILMGRGSEFLSHPIQDPETHEQFYANQWDERIYTDRSYESQVNSLSCDYPYFPDWKDKVYHEVYDTNYMFGAVWAFPFIKSPVSNDAVISLDEYDSLNLRQPLTVSDAVTMALRTSEYCRIELNEDWREYVHISETGSYNRDIISDGLLNAPSQLPEVSQSEFPSD